MKEKVKVWLLVVLLMITMLGVGKFSIISWWEFIWYPLVFSVAYFFDEIIDKLHQTIKNRRK